MLVPQHWIALVQAVSLLRLASAILFATIAFQGIDPLILAGSYEAAAVTDILDGWLARRLRVTSQTGAIVDLISDKSLTVVSVLYAAARSIDSLPLVLIAVREVIVLGFRAVQIDDNQIISTGKLFGCAMTTVLWSNTILLVMIPKQSPYESIVGLDINDQSRLSAVCRKREDRGFA